MRCLAVVVALVAGPCCVVQGFVVPTKSLVMKAESSPSSQVRLAKSIHPIQKLASRIIHSPHPIHTGPGLAHVAQEAPGPRDVGLCHMAIHLFVSPCREWRHAPPRRHGAVGPGRGPTKRPELWRQVWERLYPRINPSTYLTFLIHISRVNKDAESLLRYGLPIDSKEARELQEAVEGIKDEIRLKRYAEGKKDAQRAKTILNNKKDKLLKAVRADAKGKAQEIFTALEAKLTEVGKTFDEEAGRGSEQERAKLDLAYAQQLQASRSVSELQELMVPAGYRVKVPQEYNNLPQLQGRAEVEMLMKKPNPGEKFEIKGKLYDSIQVRWGYVWG